MAEQKPSRTGGIEGRLDLIAAFYLLLSILGLLGFFMLSESETVRKLGLSDIWIVLGIFAFVQTLILWILFRAAAEAIRLLKKIAGLPYGGRISETGGEGKTFHCSDCGAPVSINDKYCTQCGGTLNE